MTAPRHLWSGDWQRESAAAAEERAARRHPDEAPVEPPPAESPRGPSALGRALAAMRDANFRRIRGAVLIGIATLLSAGAAYAGVSALESSGTANPARSQHASAVSRPRAWLGVQTTSFPLTDGAMIIDVLPGSPADAAGLRPGEVITEVDNRPVRTPADLESALASLHAGDRARIGYQLGPSTYTTQVVLQPRPSGP
jgi:membrane-associated protease RseP (regulator of RpoE activity)